LIFFTSQGFSTSAPGTYSVRPFGGVNASPNYTLQFVNGTLTIVAPPPPTNPLLSPVTFTPGTVTTVTPDITETLTPTTLTTVNAPVDDITVNPLIGTPLAIFGPLAETMVDELAATNDPPLDEAAILLALRSPDIAPTIMMLLDNLMIIELDTILNKPQSSWTADETAFVNGFLGYINAQRAAAAAKAEADYEAWAKATVAAEDAKISQDQGQTQLMEMAALSANPPVPPNDFLAEASAGMVLTDSQSDTVLSQMAAQAAAADALDGTATATDMTYLVGAGFQLGGKSFQTVANVKVIYESENKATMNLPDNLKNWKEMSPKDRQAIAAENRANKSSSSGENSGETSSETSKTTETTTETSKVTETTTETTESTVKETMQVTTKVLEAADTLEAIGRVVSAAGIVGEAVAIVTQTAATAALYAEQATYNDAFTAAVNNANKPLGVSDLKTMMSTGEAMTYLMAAMAGGNTTTMDSTAIVNTAKPDMPLSQILNIEKNL
jgi:hypothetical protein